MGKAELNFVQLVCVMWMLSVYLFGARTHTHMIKSMFGSRPIAPFPNEFVSRTHRHRRTHTRRLRLWVKKVLHLCVTHFCRAIFLSKIWRSAKEERTKCACSFFYSHHSFCCDLFCWVFEAICVYGSSSSVSSDRLVCNLKRTNRQKWENANNNKPANQACSNKKNLLSNSVRMCAYEKWVWMRLMLCIHVFVICFARWV